MSEAIIACSVHQCEQCSAFEEKISSIEDDLENKVAALEAKIPILNYQYVVSIIANFKVPVRLCTCSNL